MSTTDREEEWYVPAEWESDPSPVEGMARGEFERLTAQVRWFRSLSLEARIGSLKRARAEQAWFDRLRPRTGHDVSHGS